MRAANARWSLTLLVCVCTGCGHFRKAPPALAQAPTLQPGQKTISKPDTSNPPVASSPLASPLPPPSAQNVPPLPPPPPPRKAKHKVKNPPKPVDTTAQAAPPATLPATPAVAQAGPSPIGQITTGDSALGERTKRETADLITETQQGLAAIKRNLSADEQVTAGQIRTFLKQAEQAMENGDMDGAHTLATKSKLLLDELTKP